MCSLSRGTMPQMLQVLRERAIGMMTAEMSTWAVARELNVYFSTISRLQRRFREFGSIYNRSHNRRPRVNTPAQDLYIQHLHLQDRLRLATRTVCITKEFMHKLSETLVSGKLICMLNVLIRVSTWLQFVVVTDLNGQMLTFDGVWHFREVFSSQMNPGLHCTGQMADSVYGIMWVNGLLMSTLWIEWPMVLLRVMVWAGVCYGQRTQEYFIDGILNAQRYRDEILRPIVVPFIHDITSCCSIIMHGPMLQESVHNSWKLKTSQFLHGQHTHRTCHPLSMFGMLWIGVYDSVFQFLPTSSNFAQPLKRSWPSFHRPQSTTWSTLCEGDALHCLRQMVVMVSDPLGPPQYSKTAHLEWSFIVASLRHTCAIIMLSNLHFDMPHLWGGWIVTNTDLDRFVNNIWEK